MYREWSLSKSLTAENGEFKHEMPDEFIGSADDSFVLKMDDDPMDHIVNNIELPIYTGIFEFLGFFLDDDDDDEGSQHEESETRTSQPNESSRGGGVASNEGERQDNSTSSQSTDESLEEVFPTSQIENTTEVTRNSLFLGETLSDSLIMQGEDLSDPLPKKERDMRISVRGVNKSSASLPVILDDSSKSSNASSINSLHNMTEAKNITSKPPKKAPAVAEAKGERHFQRNKISTANTTTARKTSLAKKGLPKDSRPVGNARVKTQIPKEKKKPVVRSKAVDVPVHPSQRRNKLDLDEAMNKRILEGKKRREEYERKYEMSKSNRFQLSARRPSHSKLYAPSTLKPKQKSKVVMKGVTLDQTQTPKDRKTKSTKAVTPDQARKFYERQLKLKQETIEKIRVQSEKHCSKC